VGGRVSTCNRTPPRKKKRAFGEAPPPGPPPPPETRIISLDRFPTDDTDTARLFAAVETVDAAGVLADGWGEVSEWPAERIRAGDWTASRWRSPALAKAGAHFAEHDSLSPMGREREVRIHKTEPTLSAGYRRVGKASRGDK
ncbi:MAG: hypothetical protein OXF41_16600, partial [bacterium]|nr:hypothetical protein [bacterium]